MTKKEKKSPLKPDAARDAKDGSHGTRCANGFPEVERRHIRNPEKKALSFEEGNCAMGGPSTASNNFISPRQEREEPAPLELPLGEIKRQIGIAVCGSKRVGTISRGWCSIGRAGLGGMIECPSHLKMARSYAAVPRDAPASRRI